MDFEAQPARQSSGWRVGLVWVAITLMVAGCAGPNGRTAAEAADWAGFRHRRGIEIVSSADVGRLDESVQLAFRGSASDVADAMDVAGFASAFAPGTDQVQPGLLEGRLDGLSGVESARDVWRSPEGQTISRLLVTGQQDGATVLLVDAFTTT